VKKYFDNKRPDAFGFYCFEHGIDLCNQIINVFDLVAVAIGSPHQHPQFFFRSSGAGPLWVATTLTCRSWKSTRVSFA
jgi:hypothetical protein